MELSPNRTQQRSGSREKREGRGSPPPLTRPLSLPLDPKAKEEPCPGPPKASSLQRYTDVEAFKEKAEKWRERLSEGERTDESSPEVQRRHGVRKNEFQ